MLGEKYVFPYQEVLKKPKTYTPGQYKTKSMSKINESDINRIKNQVLGLGVEEFIHQEQKKYIKKINIDMIDVEKEK